MIMKIGNTDFNPDACKDMSFEEFSKAFKGTYKGDKPVEVVYKLVTGNNPPSKQEDGQTIRKAKNGSGKGEKS